MDRVTCRQEKVVIPTYEIAEYDKNPMFLEKRVYQGSTGKVYPHPVCEGVSDEKVNKEYTALFLENKYLLVMILPELGGRIQRLYDKTNNYDAVYYNEVIKPALVGLVGPWISGGIEFNWPQHHRPSTFDPVDYTVTENEDGSTTVWVGETEKMFHTKGMAGFTLYPDRAYLEITGQVYNPTDRPQTFLWWANPAVPANDHTQSIFPPDVTAVMDHGKRDVSKFPIADGVYYKVDYSPGTDISRYKNIPVPTSYMAYQSQFDFIGNYDYEKKAGLLHVANHHISPGKKQWTWGNGDFGQAWDRNLTDENGPYIELMTGVFTDNQPDFTYLKPYEQKTFKQYFMPYQAVGAVKNASTEIAMNLEFGDEQAHITLYTPVALDNITLELIYQSKAVYQEMLNMKPTEFFTKSIPCPDVDQTEVTLRVLQAEHELLSYTPLGELETEVPNPAEALPAPELIDTTEKLFLAATHLEQYRHATYSPEAYYLEGLKRDPSDIRLNNGYGKYLYNKGKFAASEEYFGLAIKSATWKNPNPYDCEPYYNLGLALKRQDKIESAYAAFYKATWDGNLQPQAFYQLACIATSQGKYIEALEYVEKSLVTGLHNLKARTLKSALLRLLGQTEVAVAFAQETTKIDPLDHGSRFELYLLTGEGLVELETMMRGDNHNYIELAICYEEACLRAEAVKVLHLAPNNDEPLVHYYLYSFTGDTSELKQAENADSSYCFPNRLEDLVVLEKAVKNGGNYAAYYLGNLLYDRGRWEEAVELWEQCADQISLSIVYRNLSLAYYNKLHDAKQTKKALEKAFAMDKTDARVFFELDQLYKLLNYSLEERLDNMHSYPDLLVKRDDLYTEYITLLNLNGEYENAYQRIMQHNFHPWEGGEGKIPTQYRIALINMAQAASSKVQAIELLEQALVYPHNLGEGKLAGNMDNDLYYMLGQLYDDPIKAEAAYKLAARGEFDLSSATYYYDQPPEMMYYAALALKALGERKKADERFDAFIAYAKAHMDDEVAIDYFAVSLPDFLIFEANLTKNNQVHCCLMAALGYLGKGELETASGFAKQGLSLNQCHQALRTVWQKLQQLL